MTRNLVLAVLTGLVGAAFLHIVIVLALPGRSGRDAFSRVVALGETGQSGQGNHQFDEPMGVAVEPGPDGRVFVADCGNQRVQVLNKQGAHVRTIGVTGERGSGNRYQFHRPVGVCVEPGPDGRRLGTHTPPAEAESEGRGATGRKPVVPAGGAPAVDALSRAQLRQAGGWPDRQADRRVRRRPDHRRGRRQDRWRGADGAGRLRPFLQPPQVRRADRPSRDHPDRQLVSWLGQRPTFGRLRLVARRFRVHIGELVRYRVHRTIPRD